MVCGMALDKDSTLDDCYDEAMDNADYEGDATKATLFLGACRRMLLLRAQGITTNNRTINYEALQPLIDGAKVVVEKFGAAVERSIFTRGALRK